MARRARDHRFRAPPPSPIATAKGLRSAAVNDAVLSDYLGESLSVPDLALPESHFPSKPPLKNPPEVDYRSLIRGDDSSVRQVLAAAKDAGVVLVGGGGESLAEEARAAINSGRGVFAKPTAERTKGDLGQRWFGRRDGIGEEFYWYRLRSTETERLLQLTWPDSYATLGEKMETVSVRLQNVAECIAKILFEHVTCQTPSKRIGKVQSILCLRKRESHHVQNDASELADPKLHYSDALSLHISGEDHEFCIRQLEGSTIFMMQAGDILVTIGKPLQEWSNGELKSASAEALFQPLDDQVVSFSLEYLCSPHVLSHDPDQGTATISLTDQLLVVLILAVLYKIWSFVFS